MQFPKLCYITDRRSLRGGPLSSFLAAAIEAEIGMIQIREKDLDTQALCNLTGLAVARARGTATEVVVNDRLDVALALEASGVHLGNQSLPPFAVRPIVPQGFLVGVSCHSLDEALAAEAAGANYLLLGPVFETPSKLAFGPPLGEGKLGEVARKANIPVLALGGITTERIPRCLQAGASGIAGIRIFQEAPSLAQRVKELSDLIEFGYGAR